MRWHPAQVAWFAKQAGFSGDELVDATAYALAASNGDDHANTWTAIGGQLTHAGLWLVPVAVVRASLPDVELYDPRINAGVAYDLWRDSGGFGWSIIPQHLAESAQYVGVAEVAATHPEPPGNVPQGPAGITHGTGVAAAAQGRMSSGDIIRGGLPQHFPR